MIHIIHKKFILKRKLTQNQFQQKTKFIIFQLNKPHTVLLKTAAFTTKSLTISSIKNKTEYECRL